MEYVGWTDTQTGISGVDKGEAWKSIRWGLRATCDLSGGTKRKDKESLCVQSVVKQNRRGFSRRGCVGALQRVTEFRAEGLERRWGMGVAEFLSRLHREGRTEPVGLSFPPLL